MLIITSHVFFIFLFATLFFKTPFRFRKQIFNNVLKTLRAGELSWSKRFYFQYYIPLPLKYRVVYREIRSTLFTKLAPRKRRRNYNTNTIIDIFLIVVCIRTVFFISSKHFKFFSTAKSTKKKYCNCSYWHLSVYLSEQLLINRVYFVVNRFVKKNVKHL